MLLSSIKHVVLVVKYELQEKVKRIFLGVWDTLLWFRLIGCTLLAAPLPSWPTCLDLVPLHLGMCTPRGPQRCGHLPQPLGGVRWKSKIRVNLSPICSFGNFV